MPFERQVYVSLLMQYLDQLKRTRKSTKVMAASTVAYTDTTGNKDYLGMIASQIESV